MNRHGFIELVLRMSGVNIFPLLLLDHRSWTIVWLLQISFLVNNYKCWYTKLKMGDIYLYERLRFVKSKLHGLISAGAQ